MKEQVKPIAGKFEILSPKLISVITERNSNGTPRKEKVYLLNKGDVINVSDFFYDDGGGSWLAKIDLIKEQNRGIPLSDLKRVTSNQKIALTELKSEEKFFSTSNQTVQPNNNNPNKKPILKNVLIFSGIGLLAFFTIKKIFN